MNVDSAGLEVLSPHDCLALARTMPIGRIVFTDQALPAVQPVNFLLEDGCVIIRTGEGTKLAAAIRDTIVAFEIDDYDARTESGWSVTLVGRAESVVDVAESARLARLPLRTWAPGNRDRFVRIKPEYISGRRILIEDGPNDAEPDGDAAAEDTRFAVDQGLGGRRPRPVKPRPTAPHAGRGRARRSGRPPGAADRS
ncbi:MAG TPA: pyridoxamine 5'-phosphate oxidase family protein [Streptosporangiaceae bacterium]|nr:pyridoxamine 5'-phosphate oxidase family protein [Streptosporangiaceae bacterium]